MENRKIIIIVNGYPRSGKDTFVEFAGQHFASLGWRAHALSSIDFVKKITSDVGIPEEPKTPEKRALWAEVKQAFEKFDWFVSRRAMLCMQIQMSHSPYRNQVGFIHVREPDAIVIMKTLKNDCEFMTVFVDRPDAERVTSNSSDLDVENFSYDFTISNHSDLETLRQTARDFVAGIVTAKAISE